MKDFSHSLFDDFFWYPKINSTSSQSLRLIKEQVVHGHFLVIADTQTNGRGRKGNSWFSPLGGLWMTAAFYGLQDHDNMAILIGNCIHQALLELFPSLDEHLTLKWPNDVILDDSKLAGILIEHFTASDYTLVGIGINTNIPVMPLEVRSISTSLFGFIGHSIDNDKIASKIFDKIASSLPSFFEKGIDNHISYHNNYSYLKNKSIEIATDFGSYHGVCCGVNYEGALILEISSGLKQPFFSGIINVLSDT